MKYIDMYTAFKNDETFDMTEAELVGAKVAFQWIDQNFGTGARTNNHGGRSHCRR